MDPWKGKSKSRIHNEALAINIRSREKGFGHEIAKVTRNQMEYLKIAKKKNTIKGEPISPNVAYGWAVMIHQI